MVRRASDRSFNAKLMEEFDETEVIRASELQENEDQAALKFLRGGYSRLVHTTSEQSAKLGSVEAKLGFVEAKLLKVKNTLSQLANQLGIHPIDAESSQQVPPVTYISDPYVRNDVNRLPLDNRKSLSHKIEMPEFDASNVLDWLSKVERFFSVRRYSDLTKLDLVAFSLEGDVLLWFDREMNRREFQSWDEFRRRLLLKFGAAPVKSSENVADILEERASYSEKEGTVSASVIESAELSSHVIGLDESHLEQLFSNGLQTEMLKVLKLPEPMGLEYHTPAGTFTSTPVASVNSISFAVGTDETIFSGLSHTSQVWEPGGVLASVNVATSLGETASYTEKQLILQSQEMDSTNGTGVEVESANGANGVNINIAGNVVSASDSFVLVQEQETSQEDDFVVVNHAASTTTTNTLACNKESEFEEMKIDSESESEETEYETDPWESDEFGVAVDTNQVAFESNVSANDNTEMKVVLKLKESMELANPKKSRGLKASMFNFKRKKTRSKRRHHQLLNNYASVREDLEQKRKFTKSWSFKYKGVEEAVTIAKVTLLLQLILDDLKSHMRHRWESKLRLHSGFDGNKLTELDFHLSENHSQEKNNELLVFPWNLLLLEFFLFIHLEDKVCLSGASNRWCGWQIFDRGKKKIISGDVQNRLQNFKLTDTKLVAEYFGPFQVVERIGVVVFKDQLLPKIAAVLDSFAPVFVIVILEVVDRLSKAVQVLGLKHPFKPGWVIGVINRES